MRFADIHNRGFALGAQFHAIRTSCFKSATIREHFKIRSLSRYDCQLGLALVRMPFNFAWHALQQSTRVWMLGRPEDFLNWAGFRGFSRVHYQDAVGEACQQRRVVSNQNQRQSELFAELSKEQENLLLR
jgi:hypothetical protein